MHGSSKLAIRRDLFSERTFRDSPVKRKYAENRPSASGAAFFRILQLGNFDQNNIVSNLLYVAEGDHIFLFPSEDPTEASRSGDDQMCDTSGTLVKFDVTDISQSFTVTDIDDFFFFRSKMRMRSPVPVPMGNILASSYV